MPCRLRRMLYRAVDFLAHIRHAQWQACGRALHTPDPGVPLRPLRQAGTPGGVPPAPSLCRDVRTLAHGSADLSHRTGTGDGPWGAQCVMSARPSLGMLYRAVGQPLEESSTRSWRTTTAIARSASYRPGFI